MNELLEKRRRQTVFRWKNSHFSQTKSLMQINKNLKNPIKKRKTRIFDEIQYLGEIQMRR